MAKRTLISSESDAALVTKTANVVTAVEPSQIFKLVVPNGARYKLPNFTNVKGTLRRGAHFVLDLNVAAGTRIASASKIAFGAKSPAGESYKMIRTVGYGPWYPISSINQRDEQFMGGILVDLDVPQGLLLPEKYEIGIFVKSADLVSWTTSYLQFFVDEESV